MLQMIKTPVNAEIFIIRSTKMTDKVDEDERFVCFNPLSPHDALKHHFTFLKTQLISYN